MQSNKVYLKEYSLTVEVPQGFVICGDSLGTNILKFIVV